MHDDRLRNRLKAQLDLTIDRRRPSDLGHGVARSIEHRRSVQEHNGNAGECNHYEREGVYRQPDLTFLRGIECGLTDLSFRDRGFQCNALALGSRPLGLDTKTFRFESCLLLLFALGSGPLGSFACRFAQQSSHFRRHTIRQIRRWVEPAARGVTDRLDLTGRSAGRERSHVLGNLNGFEITERELGACLGWFRHGVVFAVGDGK